MEVKNKRGPKPGRRPDFSGVPGEIITSPPENLSWGAKTRKSPYDALLDQLSAATATATASGGDIPALRFPDARAKASVFVRARKKGLKVVCAEAPDGLYVRIEPGSDQVGEVRRERIHAALKKFGAATPVQLSGSLRSQGDLTIDAQTVATILSQMARLGVVVAGEGNLWKLNPAKKAA